MEDELLSRHRKEKKELRLKVQSLQKSIPNGDSCRRRAAHQEIAALESQLSNRHAAELQQLNSSPDHISAQESTLVLEAGVVEPKLSKAAKRRQKASIKSQLISKAVQKCCITNSSSSSALEYSAIESALSHRGLTLHKVPSDGDCLFASIAHQLDVLNLDKCLIDACAKFDVTPPTEGDAKSCVRCLRLLASAVIRHNEDDYLPFICSEADPTCNSNREKILQYCQKLETPGTWGGQLEIQALSTALKRPIEVLQSTGPVIRLGEVFNVYSNPLAPLVITYHYHAFSTGEHYNSSKPLTKNNYAKTATESPLPPDNY